MGLTTALFVLASALIHALWNAILKRTRSPEDAVTGAVVISAITSVVLALALSAPMPPRASIAWALASGALEAFYFVTLARALSRAPLAPVYTIVRGGGLVVVWPLSIAFLGERLTPTIAGGTALLVLGLVATGAAETPRAESTDEPLRKRLGWAVVCASFVGGYQIAYKLALARGGAPSAINALSLGSACIATLAALRPARARRALEAVRAQPIRIAVSGILASVGFVIFLVAMSRTGAGAAVTLRNTSIIFAQIMSAFMGDRPKRLGIVGAVLVTAGAVLLSVR
jgi:uncharacterized membrane protein